VADGAEVGEADCPQADSSSATAKTGSRILGNGIRRLLIFIIFLAVLNLPILLHPGLSDVIYFRNSNLLGEPQKQGGKGTARPAEPFVFLSREVLPHAAIDFEVKFYAGWLSLQARLAHASCLWTGLDLYKELFLGCPATLGHRLGCHTLMRVQGPVFQLSFYPL
jgi:hypothetical protein